MERAQDSVNERLIVPGEEEWRPGWSGGEEGRNEGDKIGHEDLGGIYGGGGGPVSANICAWGTFHAGQATQAATRCLLNLSD
jgi:hypothetical protein